MPSSVRPPPEVIAGFDLSAVARSGRIRRLPGGEERAVVVGDVVLKSVDDVELAAWGQDLLSRLRSVEASDGFTVPSPVAAVDGRWVVDGWIASRFVPGLRSLLDDPARVIAVGRRLAASLADVAPAAAVDHGPVLARRDRWARADRFAWGEEGIDLSSEAMVVVDRLRSWIVDDGPGHSPDRRTVVHGDLAGNVFVDPDDVPVVLDMSPLVRSPDYASAIVVADHLLWFGGGVDLVGLVGGPLPDDRLARALVFRLVAEQLADDPRHHARLDDYHRVLSALAWA